MIYSYDVVCFLCLDNWIGYKLLWLVGGGCLSVKLATKRCISMCVCPALM
jgi:hypothetical protein